MATSIATFDGSNDYSPPCPGVPPRFTPGFILVAASGDSAATPG